MAVGTRPGTLAEISRKAGVKKTDVGSEKKELRIKRD